MDATTQRKLLAETDRLGYTHLGGNTVWHPHAGTLELVDETSIREARRRLRFFGTLSFDFVTWLLEKYGPGEHELNLSEEAREYPGEGHPATLAENALLDPRVVSQSPAQGRHSRTLVLGTLAMPTRGDWQGSEDPRTAIIEQMEGLRRADAHDILVQIHQLTEDYLRRS